MWHLYEMQAHYKNGFLPLAGGVLDQPSKLMTAIAVTAGEIELCRDERDAAEKAHHSRLDAIYAAAGDGQRG